MSITEVTRILCFGDSNTWGFIPGTGQRYPANIRWTGLLQKQLGENFEVIEEGLNGRTTAFDRQDAEGKNGVTYLKACLPSHYPVDIIIIMLGTNDMKESLNKTPQQIAAGLEELLFITEDPNFTYGKNPRVIVMSPPLIDESIPGVQETHLGAEDKSKHLAAEYRKVVDKHNCEFIDTAEFIESSKIDGYHLEAIAQKKLADILTERIQKIYG